MQDNSRVLNYPVCVYISAVRPAANDRTRYSDVLHEFIPYPWTGKLYLLLCSMMDQFGPKPGFWDLESSSQIFGRDSWMEDQFVATSFPTENNTDMDVHVHTSIHATWKAI
jgi:hypothetical protein